MAKLRKASVERLGKCSYQIKSADIPGSVDGTREKRRGFIIEDKGSAMVIPFKKMDAERKRIHKVRETDHGCLKLSPSRQKISMTISFDREKDSIEAFREEFNKLVDNYIADVLDFEINECLE